MRVMEISSGRIGSTEVAKLNCTGPRTCPAFTPVDMTAPKVRMSQKLAHIQAVSSRALASSLGSLLYSSALATGGMTASQARSEEHTSELQSLMRISYAVFCLKKNTTKNKVINT